MAVLEALARFDHDTVVRFSGRRSDALSHVMKLATRVGDGYVWAVLGLLIFVIDDRGSTIIKQLALAFAIDVSLYKIIKKLFSRPRPFVQFPTITMLLVPPDEFSFPSGHTAAAFVFTTVVGMSFPVLIPLLLVTAVLIGISRVYLGVHYPTDVLAGVTLGIISGVAGIAII
ncbi:MAG: phosphatase PAP2 family protein [Bacteroidota bacterium]